jgi:uncharacterized Ntn-hydrolase superfamily protein
VLAACQRAEPPAPQAARTATPPGTAAAGPSKAAPQEAQPAQPHPGYAPSFEAAQAMKEQEEKELPEDSETFKWVYAFSDQPFVEAYGLMAVDPATSDIGVAFVSNVPGAGAFVHEARADVGAVVMTAFPDPTLRGPLLDLLAAGASPEEAVQKIVAGLNDSARDVIHIIAMDARGRSACHIGQRVRGVNTSTDYVAKDHVALFTTYSNKAGAIMWLDEKFPETAGLPLPERLLLTVEHLRKRSPRPGPWVEDTSAPAVSAALLVVRKGGGRGGYTDRLVDLRVDFSREPVAYLRGLYKTWSQANLSHALRNLERRLAVPTGPAHDANQAWLQRLRQNAKLGEKN